MEHTLALIQKSHEGDEEARNILIERNLSLTLSKSKRTPDSLYYKKTVYTSYLSTIKL